MANVERILQEIITSLKSTYGHEFFNSLNLQLSKHIGADYTFIARLNKKTNTSKTISLVAKGKLAENFEYSLKDTPCADISDDSLCIFPQGICELYPDDQLLQDMNIEGYVGTPLRDSQGNMMGIVVALHEKKIENPDFAVTLFELFSGRISAEIERTEREQELQELTKTLEDKVKERTQELSQAIDRLKQTQQEVLAKEKMASLGALVAGVAHEINSPLGVAILSGSMIDETAKEINGKIIDQSLSKQELQTGLANIKQSITALNFNLQRAAKLVDNFKQVAIDRNTDDIRQFTFSSWLDSLLSSLMPMLKKNNISLQMHLPEQPTTITTCPSKLAQVISNLVINAVIHGFPEKANLVDKKLTFTLTEHKQRIILSIADNGIGIENELIKHLFEPFYTTKRGQGSTGLGLSIVRNILTGALRGSIDITSQVDQGTKFTISLPKKIEANSITEIEEA
ncbi:sensor histidine kinase [Colwellia sp. TT2012]|uniref:sensor histidine kinase n=1 Tax=Colwellia sp. TT2012 TaxID=1720342 RepID=UPI0007090DF4|nr:ATP-binding protein [Colwellia sp. TT2012]